MTPEPSRIEVEHRGNNAVAVAGVVDSHTAGELHEHLTGLGTDRDVELDLHGVEFIDSSGLRTVVTVHQELAAAGQRLVLVGVSEAVARLLEITGLREHLNVQ